MHYLLVVVPLRKIMTIRSHDCIVSVRCIENVSNSRTAIFLPELLSSVPCVGSIKVDKMDARERLVSCSWTLVNCCITVSGVSILWRGPSSTVTWGPSVVSAPGPAEAGSPKCWERRWGFGDGLLPGLGSDVSSPSGSRSRQGLVAFCDLRWPLLLLKTLRVLCKCGPHSGPPGALGLWLVHWTSRTPGFYTPLFIATASSSWCGLLLQMSHVPWSVCLSVGRTGDITTRFPKQICKFSMR